MLKWVKLREQEMRMAHKEGKEHQQTKAEVFGEPSKRTEEHNLGMFEGT
jgi:hypothetical protein